MIIISASKTKCGVQFRHWIGYASIIKLKNSDNLSILPQNFTIFCSKYIRYHLFGEREARGGVEAARGETHLEYEISVLSPRIVWIPLSVSI